MTGRNDTPKRQDLIYDVGMHEGEDAEFYLRKGFRAVGLEANPDLVAGCRNGLRGFIDAERLTLIEGAIVSQGDLGTGQASVPFHRNDGLSMWSTVLGDRAARRARLGADSTVIDADAVDFAGVPRRHGVPRYMKVDIEGCEMACVDALKDFAERPDYVSIEADTTGYANIRQEIDALANLGYDGFQAINQLEAFRVRSPPRPAREGQYVAHSFEPNSSGLFGDEPGDDWKSKREILHLYHVITLGHFLLGDDGAISGWKFRGAWRLRKMTRRALNLYRKRVFPGWYDTYARHSAATRHHPGASGGASPREAAL